MSNSNYFAGIEIKSDETFVEALCRAIPERQRALTGLALKIMYLRLRKMNGEYVDESEEINVINESNRLRNMSNEEYGLEKLRSNNI